MISAGCSVRSCHSTETRFLEARGHVRRREIMLNNICRKAKMHIVFWSLDAKDVCTRYFICKEVIIFLAQIST